MRFSTSKKYNLWSDSKLGTGNCKPILSSVDMKFRRKLHLPNSYYFSFKEKEDDLQRALSLFVQIK